DRALEDRLVVVVEPEDDPGVHHDPVIMEQFDLSSNFLTRLKGLCVSPRLSSKMDSMPTKTDTQPLSAASLTISSSSPKKSVDWHPHLMFRGLSAAHSSRQ